MVAQKRDYSTQKGRHLDKLHLWVSTRGYILFITGLWPAVTNDATIMKTELGKGISFNKVLII